MGLKELNALSKFLEYVLGRRPDEFGLVPDREGFVRIKDLLKALGETEGYKHVKEGLLNELQISLAPSKFEMTGKMIRAIENHLDMYKYAEDIPNLLYTAIREKAYPSVAKNGLYPQENEYIVLAKKREMAERIGQRKDNEPVILEVSVNLAKDEGVFFYTAGPELYLSGYLSKDCLFGPALPKEKPEKKKKKKETEKNIFIPDPFEDVSYEDYDPKGKKGSWKRDKKRFRREKKDWLD